MRRHQHAFKAPVLVQLEVMRGLSNPGPALTEKLIAVLGLWVPKGDCHDMFIPQRPKSEVATHAIGFR